MSVTPQEKCDSLNKYFINQVAESLRLSGDILERYRVEKTQVNLVCFDADCPYDMDKPVQALAFPYFKYTSGSNVLHNMTVNCYDERLSVADERHGNRLWTAIEGDCIFAYENVQGEGTLHVCSDPIDALLMITAGERAISFGGNCLTQDAAEHICEMGNTDIALWVPRGEACTESAGNLQTYGFNLRVVETDKTVAECMADGDCDIDRMVANALEIKTPADVEKLAWLDPIDFDKAAEESLFDSCVQFPPDVLDHVPWLRDFARGIAVQFQVPYELAAMFCIGAVAATGHDRVAVEIKKNWTVTTNLYLLGVYPPGSAKSPILDAVTRPFVEWENNHANSTKRDRQLAAQAEKTIKARQTELVNKAKKADSEMRAQINRELADLEDELANLPPRKPRRLIYEDFTEESLALKLAEKQNRECGIVVSDEASRLYDILGGLNTGGKGSIVLMTKARDGGRYVRSRVTTDEMVLHRPILTIMQMTQPVAFDEMRANEVFAGRGLLARFVILKGKINFRNYDVDAEPISEVTWRRYAENLTNLLNYKSESDIVLRLSPDALKEFQSVRKEIMPRLDAEHGDLGDESVAEWGAKSFGLAAQIACALHRAEHGTTFDRHDISLQNIQGGIALMKLALTRTAQLAGTVGELPSMVNAKYLLRHIHKLHDKAGGKPVSRDDLWEMVKKRMKTANRLDAAMDVLVKLNWVSLESVKRDGVSKPAQIVRLNPKAAPHA